MIENYEGCEKCPLKDRPAVLGTGVSNAKYMLIGEAPGINEVYRREPFVGVTGQLLRNSLKGLGLPLSDCWITNACLCHPEGNKTPSITAVKSCRERLMSEIAGIRPQKILTLGGTALSSLFGEGKSLPVTKWRGQGLLFKPGWTETVIGEEDLIDIPVEIYTVPTYHPSAVNRDPDLFRDFAQDVLKLMGNWFPVSSPEIQVSIARSAQDVDEMLELLSTATFVSCDLETTGFSPLADRMRSIGIGALTDSGEGYSAIIPADIAEMNKDTLYTFFKNWDRPMIFHNLKFDLQFLQVWFKDGVPWYEKWYRPQDPQDTMLMQYAQDERGSGGEQGGRGYRVHSLKAQARIRYDIPDYHFDFEAFNAQPEEERDYEKLYTYQGIDIYVTCRLWEDLSRELEEEDPDLLKLCRDILVPAAIALGEAELTGFPIDIPYLQNLKGEMEIDLSERLSRLHMTTDHMTIELPEFNPNSPTQAKKALYAIGFCPVNTEKETLLLHLKSREWLPEIKEFVQDLIDYRQKSKILQTYVNGLLSRVDSDGRVRSDFMVHGADTGRLSSRDPNLQNIPILMGKTIRNAFISVPGYKLINADESQVELRVAAWYSQDKEMIRIFKAGEDIHVKVASMIFEKPENEITYYERYMAKYVDFGVVYGRGPQSLTEGFEAEYIIEHLGGHRWTIQEAKEIIARFLAPYPNLVKFIKETQREAKAQGYVELPTGRRRRFPLITNDTVSHMERQAVNTRIQGLASDICLTSLVKLNDVLPDGAYIISTVHDSILFLVRDDLVEQVIPLIRDVMTHPTIIDLGDLPLDVEIHVGDRWGELEVIV